MKKKLITLLVVCAGIVGVFVCINLNYVTPIFMYHSLDKNNVSNCTAVERDIFYEQMRQIEKLGYKVIGLEKYCKLLKDGKSIPKKSVILTFDDGYKDNLEAIKILEEFNYPATIFIIYDNTGKNGYLSEKDINLFLKESKVTIGSHTLTHAYLPNLKLLDMKKELAGSKQDLFALFNQNINTIAYPVGAFNKTVLEEADNSGYLCACATNRGFSKSLDRFALRRIKITNNDLGIRLKAKLSGFYNIFRKVKYPY